MGDWVRWVAIVETAAFMVLAGALGGRYLTRRGAVVLAFGAALALREVLIVAAIYTNLAAEHPISPGIRLYAAAMAPVVLALAVIEWRARRTP